MKAKYGWIDEWQTEADEDVTLIKGIAAFVVFGLFLASTFGCVLLIWAAR